MLQWQTVELRTPDGSKLRVTATPARHGPAGIEPYCCEVIGFALALPNEGARPIYVTGDTVWWDGVAEVAAFSAGVVLLFAGAAQTRGPFNLTMDVNDAIETAHAFPDAVIGPAHCDSWAHFTQDRGEAPCRPWVWGHGCAFRSQGWRALPSCRNSR
jgi:hypothetical protein